MVSEGMSATNQSDSIKETVKWGLDFHLINHPLDCPVCDQAGECELQNQYMKFGSGYDSEMAEKKVKKNKVVDLGKEVVLDSERCVLCSRCVRFTSEITRTNELGIFNRGDRSEVGTFKGKPLNNNYSVNTVDICPVGALTSKDFRFNQRVWYLKNKKSICTGCSTGCNVKAYFNEDGYFRFKPVVNQEINGYWMCDEGRKVYKSTNKENRLMGYELQYGDACSKEEAFKVAQDLISSAVTTALVVTGQQSNEEYESIISYFKETLNSEQIYHWHTTPGKEDEFDGLLMRGDKNPNTKGLQKILSEKGLGKDVSELSSVDTLVVVGPENMTHVKDLKAQLEKFIQSQNVIWLGSALVEELKEMAHVKLQMPLRTYLEKTGTFTNHAGQDQKVTVVKTVNKQALALTDWVQLMQNQEVQQDQGVKFPKVKTNFFMDDRGTV